MQGDQVRELVEPVPGPLGFGDLHALGRSNGVRVRADVEQIVAEITAAAEPGDHLLIMSNAAFGAIHDKLLAALGARFV